MRGGAGLRVRVVWVGWYLSTSYNVRQISRFMKIAIRWESCGWCDVIIVERHDKMPAWQHGACHMSGVTLYLDIQVLWQPPPTPAAFSHYIISRSFISPVHSAKYYLKRLSYYFSTANSFDIFDIWEWAIIIIMFGQYLETE